jgi:hypothetical protein
MVQRAFRHSEHDWVLRAQWRIPVTRGTAAAGHIDSEGSETENPGCALENWFSGGDDGGAKEKGERQTV